jgi:hypothetical protein
VLELAGPLAVAALVLAAGGLFKLRDPSPTGAMFTTLGVRRSRLAMALALVSACVELGLGLATVFVGGRVLGALTAIAFVAFALVALRLTRAPVATSCGCFGRLSAEPTAWHVGVNVAVALGAAVAAVVDAPGFVEARQDLPGGGLVFGALALLGAWLVVATLTVLPEAMTAARRGPRRPTVQTFEITGAP